MALNDALSYFFFALAAISFAWTLTRLPDLIRTRKDAKVLHEIRRVARRRREPIETVLMQFLTEHGDEPIGFLLTRDDGAGLGHGDRITAARRGVMAGCFTPCDKAARVKFAGRVWLYEPCSFCRAAMPTLSSSL